MTNKANWKISITGLGYSWLFTSLIIFVLAANYSNNLLLFMALCMLSLWVNSALFAWLNVRKLSINHFSCDAVYAEQAATFVMSINNPGKKLRPGLKLATSVAHSESTYIPPENNERLAASLSSAPLPRGLYPLNWLAIGCDYPLGLITVKKKFSSKAQLWVYPSPKGNQPVPKPKAQQGSYLKREQGDFSHVRHYERGDSMNHIAWKQMARTGEVMTKEFEGGEGQSQTQLDYGDIKCADIKGSDIKYNNSEARLSQLCQWILDCHQRQIKYALTLPGISIDASQGEGHKETCLQALASYGVSLDEKVSNDRV